MTDKFLGAGELEIFLRKWLGDVPPQGVLVIAHGMGEHSGRYDHVARFFAARGLVVYAHDHQGHGRSGGSLGTVAKFADFLDDLESVVARARREHPRLPLVLLGHSMGGLIVTAYLIDQRERPDLLVLSGPALVPLLSPGDRTIDPTRLSRDPEIWKQYLEDPYVLRERVQDDLFAKLVEGLMMLPGHARDLDLPILLIHGEVDALCSAEGARQYVESSSSTDITVRIYPEGRHEMLNEINRDEVMNDVWDWIRARLTPLARG